MLSFAIALLIAALAGMGIGGGGLLVLWLVLVCGTDTRTAQGLNLLFFVISSLSALCVHRFAGRRKRLPAQTGFLLLFAIPGALLGCRLSAALPTGTVRVLFGWFLLLSGALSARKQCAALFPCGIFPQDNSRKNNGKRKKPQEKNTGCP